MVRFGNEVSKLVVRGAEYKLVGCVQVADDHILKLLREREYAEGCRGHVG